MVVQTFSKTNLWATVTMAITFAIVDKVATYEGGAPSRICDTMLPGHSEQSLLADMPFNISPDRTTVRGLDTIVITVSSINPSKYTFKGMLFVMKLPNKNSKAFGTFHPIREEKDTMKTIDCFGVPGSGITHSNSEPKRTVKFQWTAPNDTSSEYELHATLARDYNSFWANYILPTKIRVNVNAPASKGIRVPSYSLVACLAACLFIQIISNKLR